VVAVADPDPGHPDPPVLGQNQPDAASQHMKASRDR
jgi:hypothetical protein